MCRWFGRSAASAPGRITPTVRRLPWPCTGRMVANQAVVGVAPKQGPRGREVMHQVSRRDHVGANSDGCSEAARIRVSLRAGVVSCRRMCRQARSPVATVMGNGRGAGRAITDAALDDSFFLKAFFDCGRDSIRVSARASNKRHGDWPRVFHAERGRRTRTGVGVPSQRRCCFSLPES